MHASPGAPHRRSELTFCLAGGRRHAGGPPAAQQAKPNIILIVSDDTGYGDLGPYGGGDGRGMPTPNIDRLANEGMTFFSFYAQPSCTPGPRRHADRAHSRTAAA